MKHKFWRTRCAHKKCTFHPKTARRFVGCVYFSKLTVNKIMLGHHQHARYQRIHQSTAEDMAASCNPHSAHSEVRCLELKIRRETTPRRNSAFKQHSDKSLADTRASGCHNCAFFCIRLIRHFIQTFHPRNNCYNNASTSTSKLLLNKHRSEDLIKVIHLKLYR